MFMTIAHKCNIIKKSPKIFHLVNKNEANKLIGYVTSSKCENVISYKEYKEI